MIYRTFALYLLLASTAIVAKQHDIHVFVHGSVLSGVSFLDIERILKDTWPDDESSWCERIINTSRQHGTAYKSDLMLQRGLVRLEDQHILHELPEQLRHLAAYHIIRAFERFSASLDTEPVEREYRTYGWIGVLSNTIREKEAFRFYTALRAEDLAIKQRGDTVRWHIYSHSHGAQLVLALPKIRAAQDNNNDDDFFIETVVLSAAPLYYQNARNILRGMFRTIVNVYSRGDLVQIADIFSTPTRSCVRTLREILPLPTTPTTTIIDLEIQGCGSSLFGHGSFFILNRYVIPYMTSRAQRAACKDLFTQISPLPLVTFYPLILNILRSCPVGYYGLHVNIYTQQSPEGSNTTLIHIGQDSTAIVDRVDALPVTITVPITLLHDIRNDIQRAYQKIGYVSEARKALIGLQHIFSSLFTSSSQHSQ